MTYDYKKGLLYDYKKDGVKLFFDSLNVFAELSPVETSFFIFLLQFITGKKQFLSCNINGTYFPVDTDFLFEHYGLNKRTAANKFNKLIQKHLLKKVLSNANDKYYYSVNPFVASKSRWISRDLYFLWKDESEGKISPSQRDKIDNSALIDESFL